MSNLLFRCDNCSWQNPDVSKFNSDHRVLLCNQCVKNIVDDYVAMHFVIINGGAVKIKWDTKAVPPKGAS